MTAKYLFLLALISQTTAAGAANTMSVGDGMIDGRRIHPYEFSWQQCSLADGQWQNRASLTEAMATHGDSQLRRRQTVVRPDGTVVQSDNYFDRGSFALLRMEMEATLDGVTVATSKRQFDANGYSGVIGRGDESTAVKGKIDTSMLHGGALGLPLSTLEYQDKPLHFKASMVSFDGTYEVKATWVGREVLQFEGNDIEAWLIDVEWHHNESGDIYPAGPDESGGRYWVVSNPPEGFPYVPRYQTDTYAVEFISGVCPDEAP